MGNLPIGSYLPFQPNPLFEGRVDHLKQLAKSLLSDANTNVVINQAITGMGGLGKTQLAVEFAWRYGSYFRGVHWLNLADPAQFDSEIARCGLEMTLPNFPADQPSQVALTLHTWKADGPRLLVLDNFEAAEQVNSILPRLRHSNLRLLVTSRRSDWTRASGLHALPLDVFSPEEGLAFLTSALAGRNDTKKELVNLADRLGYLPLALELASRYLNGHARLRVAEYLEQAKQALDHPAMHDWHTDRPAPTQHDLDLQRTFALSWESVKDKTAQNVFKTAGYLAPNTPIPPAIFEKALGASGNACDEALDILYGLGLLRHGEEAQPVIHPLLAEYARALANENQKILEPLVDVLRELSHEANNTGIPVHFVPIRPHLPVTAAHAEDGNLEDAGVLWNNYGYYLWMIADYLNARDAYERALKIDEARFGPNHPNVAIRVNNLGSVLQDLGDLPGARVAYERALKIDESSFGPDHPNVAIRVNNLGNVLQALGDLPGARAAYERALKIDESSFGPDHPNVAIRVNNLGSVMQALGDLPGARVAYERALKIDETRFGPDHPNVARDVNNLGLVLQDLGDLPGARAAFERALKIDEARFGPDHPKVAIRVNNLGSVLKALGDLPGARADLERALKIFKEFLPPDHPNIKIVQGNLDSLE